jgi:hypothetical protein
MFNGILDFALNAIMVVYHQHELNILLSSKHMNQIIISSILHLQGTSEK